VSVPRECCPHSRDRMAYEAIRNSMAHRLQTPGDEDKEEPSPDYAAAAMIWASTWARRVGERQDLSVSAKRSSTPSSKAATTVACT
jgi:hypothetical protein